MQLVCRLYYVFPLVVALSVIINTKKANVVVYAAITAFQCVTDIKDAEIVGEGSVS